MFQLQTKVTQSLSSVFQHAQLSVCSPLIHSVAQPVLEMSLSAGSHRPDSHERLTLIQEAIRMFDALVALARDDTR